MTLREKLREAIKRWSAGTAPTYSDLAKELGCPEPSVRAMVQEIRRQGHTVLIQSKRVDLIEVKVEPRFLGPTRKSPPKKNSRRREGLEIRQAIREMAREMTREILGLPIDDVGDL